MPAQPQISQCAGITTAYTNWHIVWLNEYTTTANQTVQMTSLMFSMKGCRHRYSVSHQLVRIRALLRCSPTELKRSGKYLKIGKEEIEGKGITNLASFKMLLGLSLLLKITGRISYEVYSFLISGIRKKNNLCRNIVICVVFDRKQQTCQGEMDTN